MNWDYSALTGQHHTLLHYVLSWGVHFPLVGVLFLSFCCAVDTTAGAAARLFCPPDDHPAMQIFAACTVGPLFVICMWLMGLYFSLMLLAGVVATEIDFHLNRSRSR